MLATIVELEQAEGVAGVAKAAENVLKWKGNEDMKPSRSERRKASALFRGAAKKLAKTKGTT